MMLMAHNSDKQWEDLSRLTKSEIEGLKQEQWYCPTCQSKVVIKNGPHQMSHFSHWSKDVCEAFSDNESQAHLLGKEKIMSNAVRFGYAAQLEAYLPELKQRPDVLISPNLAIEVQCSALNEARLKERTSHYQTHGYQVVWLLGPTLHLKHRMRDLHKQVAQTTLNLGCHLYEYHIDASEIHLLYGITEHDSRLYFKRKIWSLTESSLLEIVTAKVKKKTVAYKSPILEDYEEQSVVKCQKKLRHQQKEMMTLQSFLYEHHLNVLSLPRMLLYPTMYHPTLGCHEIILRYYVCAYFSEHDTGTIKDILFYIKEQSTLDGVVLDDYGHTQDCMTYSVIVYVSCLLEHHRLASRLSDMGEKVFFLVKTPIDQTKIEREILWLPLKYDMIIK